jgi:DNA-binding MarR family transcriptional regulator
VNSADQDLDDLRLLKLLAEHQGETIDSLAALANDRRMTTRRVARWLAGARQRGLVEIKMDADALGRHRGPRRYWLNESGARLLNALSAGQGNP